MSTFGVLRVVETECTRLECTFRESGLERLQETRALESALELSKVKIGCLKRTVETRVKNEMQIARLSVETTGDEERAAKLSIVSQPQRRAEDFFEQPPSLTNLTNGKRRVSLSRHVTPNSPRP